MDGNTADGRVNIGALRVRLGEMPTISVLLTSGGPIARLEECLSTLLEQRRSVPVEIVVARAGEVAEVEALCAAYPDVRFCQTPPETSVADLRMAGMTAVSGDILVLRPDDPVPNNWLAQMVESRQQRARKGLSE